MKKVLSIALVLLLTLSLFAACGEKTPDSPLASAKAYLEQMYQTGEKGEVMAIEKDKEVLASVTIDGVSFPVEWSVTVTEGAADSVKITDSNPAIRSNPWLTIVSKHIHQRSVSSEKNSAIARLAVVNNTHSCFRFQFRTVKHYTVQGVGRF